MAKRGRSKRNGRDNVAVEPQNHGPRAADLTVGDYANGVPNIRIGEMFKSFARQLPWVLPALLIGTGAAWYFTKDFKRSYMGEGRILVQLGPEYIFESVTSEMGGNGLMLTPDHIVLNEIGLMKNSEVIDQVIGEMQSDPQLKARFAGKEFRKIEQATSLAEKNAARVELRSQIENAFHVAPKPKSSIVDLSFKHEDGEVAVKTLNAFIDAYMSYRRTIFVEGSGDALTERRVATEQQLNQNERAIQRFLVKNGVSDFASERGGVQKRTEELRASLNKLRGEMAETEAGLATVENQLRGIPATIDLYVDDRASQRIAQAELELKQLLAKYLPTSDPVRQKQTEISELKSLTAANGGRATGGRRVGPNTVHQELLTRRNTLQSTADSYREKEYTLQAQLDSADAKVRRLQSLSPEYQNLLRERDTLDSRLKSYTTKEQEALVNQQQAEANSENIKVIARAGLPRKGRNMRLLSFALATLGWGFTLFMLAMLRVFLDPRLYATPGPSKRRAAGLPESEIPEPVAPFEGDYAAKVAPAAATGLYSDEYLSDDAVYGGTSYVPGSNTAQAYATTDVHAQDYVSPYDTGHATLAQHGNTAAAVDLYDNPYLTGAQAGNLEPAAVQVADDSHGVEGDVPVLGTVPPSHEG